jgi:sn-glycerol 3-phosphate transport system substrate-binding protein
MKIKTFFLGVLTFFHVGGISASTREIVFWHAFEGVLLEKFAEVVQDFNYQSGQFQVKLVYAGNYTQTFNKGVDAFEHGNPPHILQVYEVATQTMTLKPQMYKAVDTLMRSYYKKFDPAVYIDAVREFYSTSEGEMFSFPWNVSTGILFYNKALFAEIGLDPEKPPKTWDEVEKIGIKLVDAGYNGFVTAWPAAYHLELLCSWHNLPFATCENGYKSLSARLIFNDFYQTRHVQKLAEWQKNGVFNYQGRSTKEPEAFFTSGRCGILLQGANRMEVLKRQNSLSIGVGFMPYWQDIKDAPYNLNIGGSSFWVIAGFDEEVYRGIAQFLAYLSLPEIQTWWHQETGYLPVTEAAYYLSKKKGFYENNPAAEIAVLEVMRQKPTPYTKGIRLGNYTVVREKIIDYLEKAFAGELTAKEALDRAVEAGNRLLDEFEQAHAYPHP